MEKNKGQQKHLVIFSGAGMSAESGLKTFRDNNGLWENYKIEEVATPEAWSKNKQLVLDFYNQRRKQLLTAEPNSAHTDLADLEKHYQITVITQNIDDLHERAGSTNVLHLHGELNKVKSEKHGNLIYPWKNPELCIGDLCEKGHQLRPHVVWFGEAVPMMDKALEIAQTADILIVIGTSLNVYPAADVVNYVPSNCINYLIDPAPPIEKNDFTVIKTNAQEGMRILKKKLLSTSVNS